MESMGGGGVIKIMDKPKDWDKLTDKEKVIHLIRFKSKEKIQVGLQRYWKKNRLLETAKKIFNEN